MGMLTLERGSAECREGENWRWCCKLNFRAAAWKIQHYTMQELVVLFLQLLVTSGSKIGSFLSLAWTVQWVEVRSDGALFFLCTCGFMRYFFNHLCANISYTFMNMLVDKNSCPEFWSNPLKIRCSFAFSIRKVAMSFPFFVFFHFSDRQKCTLNSSRMWKKFCAHCKKNSDKKNNLKWANKNVYLEVFPTNCDRCSGNSWPWNKPISSKWCRDAYK